MTTRILIMGLPGSGKTRLAANLTAYLFPSVSWFNADAIREKYNDWDFSYEGRIRQGIRMRQMADESTADFVICDFVAPLPEMRTHFDAECLIWMDTLDTGRYDDTNKIFVPPTIYDFRVTELDATKWAKTISEHLLK